MFGVSETFAFTQSYAGEATAAKKQRQEEKQTVLPVTIRLVEDAIAEPDLGSSGCLMIHGVEAGMLLLIGAIEAWSRQAMSVEFRLNDGTGRLKARYYQTDRQVSGSEKLGAGQYVSVFGNVRTAPELHFAVAGIRAVQSADEIAYHMIEVAHAAIKLQNSPSQPKSGVASLPATLTVPAVAELQTVAELQRPAKIAEPQQQVPGAKVATEVGALRIAVLSFLRAEGDGRPEGVEFSTLCAQFSSAAKVEVHQVLELLVDAGEVFTTIDDTHYSCV